MPVVWMGRLWRMQSFGLRLRIDELLSAHGAAV